MQAQNIDDVLQILDGIIADCKAKRDPLGYFPALYRQVTLKVKQGIAAGFFDDGPRMDRFDALFASRYFTAYDAFRSGGQPTKSWQLAFQATQSGNLIILQDLLVGINAHINLDLGVVAGETFQGQALQDFHGDFNKINDILFGLIPPVETVISRFSPLIGLLEKIGGQDMIRVLDFSMDAARDDAWLHAVLLSMQPPALWPPDGPGSGHQGSLPGQDRGAALRPGGEGRRSHPGDGEQGRAGDHRRPEFDRAGAMRRFTTPSMSV